MRALGAITLTLLLATATAAPESTPTPLVGSTCSTTGPSNWWGCCENKLTSNSPTSDATCPPPDCSLLSDNGPACCEYKAANNITDEGCEYGLPCVSEGPTAWWSCCLPKLISGNSTDTSCPPPCGNLEAADDVAACCEYKADAGETDSFCVAPTSSPTQVPTLVPTSTPTGTAVPTIAPTVAPTVAPTSEPIGGKCETTGPANWWGCCQEKTADGTVAKDPTCPPKSCGVLTPQANIDECCDAAGGYDADPTCPCNTTSSSNQWACCSAKDEAGTADPSCPPVCGTLTPQSNVDLCCTAVGGYAKDETCPCETAGPEGWLACCDARNKTNTKDSTCPVPVCGDLTPQANVDKCCIQKGGTSKLSGDDSCPPPCENEGPEGWWACCEKRFADGIPDDTCPPKTCDLLKPQSNIDSCCDYKGIFTSDESCPLVVCYDYVDTLAAMEAIIEATTRNMESTDNATEIVAYATEGLQLMRDFIAGNATSTINSTIVFENYPISVVNPTVE